MEKEILYICLKNESGLSKEIHKLKERKAMLESSKSDSKTEKIKAINEAINQRVRQLHEVRKDIYRLRA